jgi:hypothetical protein
MTWQVLDSGVEPVTGCAWSIIDLCDANVSYEVGVAADKMAIGVLHAASGRQFGLCARTIRPCMEDCNGLQLFNPPQPRYVYIAGEPFASYLPWARVQCGVCVSRRCACARVSQIVLPNHRIRSVREVKIDGVVLDPSAYRLAGRRLIRMDGGAWPRCQADDAADDAVGSWSVEYVYGRPVDEGGQIATGVYACEIAKSLSGNECELPQRVQTVSRQGVTIGFVDPMDFLSQGLTGLYVVDSWIKQVNPSGLARRAGMLRADDF